MKGSLSIIGTMAGEYYIIGDSCSALFFEGIMY